MDDDMKPQRRTDIRCVTIEYMNGEIDMFHMWNGHVAKFTNHDAGNIKDRQEWDEVEVKLVGEKRELRHAE